MARASRRIQRRRWTRSTVAFRSSTWTPRPLRSDGCQADPPAGVRQAVAQIQFWKIISRLNVSIDVPTNAAEIGSIAAKPANPSATKAHNSQRGLLRRLNTYTSARLAIVADGR